MPVYLGVDDLAEGITNLWNQQSTCSELIGYLYLGIATCLFPLRCSRCPVFCHFISYVPPSPLLPFLSLVFYIHNYLFSPLLYYMRSVSPRTSTVLIIQALSLMCVCCVFLNSCSTLTLSSWGICRKWLLSCFVFFYFSSAVLKSGFGLTCDAPTSLIFGTLV